MYLRNRWYCAAVSDELGTAPLGRILLDEPVVLYRKSDGALVALEDRCCHRRAPLSKGKVEGDKLRCGYHGFLYEPGGNVVWVPGQDKVPPGARVRAYPLVEKHGFAWIWMGAPSQADPATIPDFHWNDDPEFAAVAGLLPVAADYRLLMDNLMDLSHVSFLHAATIGSTMRVVLSPTPPEECLSTAISTIPVKSRILPESTMARVKSVVSCAVMPFKTIAMAQADT